MNHKQINIIQPVISLKTELQMYKNILLIIIILLLLLFNASPQNSKLKTFEHYNPDQGMSSYLAPYIIQDKTGYLWFGTYDGINRYYGYSFTTYKNEPGKPNSINSGTTDRLFEKTKKVIYGLVYHRVEKLDRTTGKFTHLFPHPMGETL